MALGQIIILAVVSIVGLIFLILAIGALASWLASKTKKDTLSMILTLINEVCYSAVIQVGETFVKDIKQSSKDGKLTLEEAKEAFKKAKDIIIGTITPKIVKLAELVGIELDKLIDSTIERFVSELKDKWTKK